MQLKLVKKLDEARGTKSFFFEIADHSSAETPLTWLSGQYIYITLPKLNYEDPRGATRHFTISASPTEGDLVRITIRVRQESGYKKTLDELPLGTIVEGKGPQGTFTIDTSASSIFLAGGIGITPFRSFIKYNIDKGIKTPIYLIYSNSDSEFIFKKELDQWQLENDFLKITYFDTSVSGHLDAQKLSNLVPNAYFYVVGPNKFVNAMEDILEQLNIPSGKILTEKFTGY